MRRPLISVVTVLLLAGAAGCSSSSSDAEDAPGAGSGSGSSSAADRADGSGSQADENQGGGSGSGGSGSGGTSGGGTGGTLGKSGGDGGTSSPSGTGGVLLGADSLPSPAADHCLTKNLKAAAVSTGKGRASVVITNKASGSCSVSGFPSLLFIGGSGPLELPVDWDGSAADADKFSLASGGSASATVTFTSLDECDEITGVNVVPPGEARPLTASFTSGGKKQAVRICDTGVRVTAFAPSK